MSSLIDQENRLWLDNVVNELFPMDDAALILKMPLNVHNFDDRFMWHHY